MDAKTELGASGLRLPGHARLIDQRLPVFWGGWSMMQATLALIDAARAAADFRRYVLVSGDSLPVRPLDHLEAALVDERREYIDLEEVPDDPSLAGLDEAEGTARHGKVQPWRRYNSVYWDHRLLNPFQREAAAAHYGVAQDRMDWLRGDIARLVDTILAERRTPCPYPSFWHGAQWWALTGQTLAALRPELSRPEVRNWFGAIQVPDEHVFQTALANNRQWLGDRAVVGAPMWTDHARRAQGKSTLDAEGFRTAAARHPQVLFARKFSPHDAPDVAVAIAGGHYERDVLGVLAPRFDAAIKSRL
jgi:hypothetical protein